MALSKIDLANMVENDLAAGSQPLTIIENKINFRNIIINGDMSQAQRSTSTASITGIGYHTIDRFSTLIATAGTWTQSQSTTVPSGQGFAKSLKMDCTTADSSLSAGDYLIINQKFEGQNLQYLKKGTSSAQSTTLSFWVRSNKTGTYIIQLNDVDNNRSISKSYTISSSDTWEKKTLTFAGDTTGAFDNDNTHALDVRWWLASGSNFTSGTLQTSWGSITNADLAVGQVNLADSTSNEWYITGVQLEVGSSASDFEFLPFDVNLQRCQRYYYVYADGDAPGGMTSMYNGSQLGGELFMPVTMRAAATLTDTTGTDYYTNFRNGASDGFNSLTSGKANNHQISWFNASEVSGTAGHSGFFRVTSNGRIVMEAEL
tara:strand:- start:174 stop:1295 length:1122 start_codon:yes stop_codon:yes gene_type:complete